MRVKWPNSDCASLHDAVVKASEQTYKAQGFTALPYWDLGMNGNRSFDLSLPQLGRIEHVETGDSFDKLDPRSLAERMSRGVDVWVLVPLELLGKAHDRLRGLVSHVQPWWLHEDGTVRFGRAEKA